MSLLWWIIGVALLIVWALSIFDIVRRHLGAKRTAAWILIVIILPIVGSIVYWMMRKPEPGDAEHTYEAQQSRREDAKRRAF
jgi:hypothetical protein